MLFRDGRYGQQLVAWLHDGLVPFYCQHARARRQFVSAQDLHDQVVRRSSTGGPAGLFVAHGRGPVLGLALRRRVASPTL
eukprot:1343963-Amorphochlora_amoeboformis.AAC.1